MKRRAILYIRVSTDEQTNGYSPADQKERLLKYCDLNNIEVVKIFNEDESARDFENRPEWQKILQYIKSNKNIADVILFAKWDRFSRNVAEAYIEIKKLKKLGIEPQAMEQPLDFSIPESKIMLAIYLAAPEVDNDRRALNTFNGMRKAKKEGRWVASALKGYKMSRDEKNKPVMIPEGGENEKFVRYAFKEFATGLYNIEELRHKLNKEGFKCSRSQFWAILRNKTYTGKIFIPAFKDEPAEWVNGLHEPLVDEKTFFEVQDILEGKKKTSPSKYNTKRNELPLRGFLACPQCGRNLTGSASRGHTGERFFYYHCSNGCKERKNAKEVNNYFMKLLEALRFNKEGILLFGEVLKKELHTSSKNNKAELIKINSEIEKLNGRLKSARILLLDNEITPKEYKEIKIETEESIKRLKLKQADLNENNENLAEQIDFCVALLSKIDSYYEIADIQTKQKIISSVFPEKLIYDKNKYRTVYIEEAVELLCLKNNKLESSKTGKHPINGVLSYMVAPPGIEPGFSV